MRCSTWADFLEVYSRDISYGGIFVEMDEPPPVDTELEIRLQSPDARAVVLHGRVVRISSDDAQPRGAGIEFTGIGSEDELVLYRLIRHAKDSHEG